MNAGSFLTNKADAGHVDMVVVSKDYIYIYKLTDRSRG